MDVSSYIAAAEYALEWLRQQGVDLSQLRPHRYRLTGFGMRSEAGRFGFRIEYDNRNHAHINVLNQQQLRVLCRCHICNA